MEDGPPVFPSDSSCPMVLRIPPARPLYAYRILTFSDQPSQTVRLEGLRLMAVLTPVVLLPRVWPLPLSLATTRGISVDFSSSRYLDVSVPGVPLAYLCIQYAIHGSSPCVLPHSDIRGSKLICSSPQLIAACHVLHRLLMPRHSPYALFRLNFLSVLDPSRTIAVLFQNCMSFLNKSVFILLQQKVLPFVHCFHHMVKCVVFLPSISQERPFNLLFLTEPDLLSSSLLSVRFLYSCSLFGFQ